MPQGRRKTPFSGKAKKAQMMAKRERKEEEAASRVLGERFSKRDRDDEVTSSSSSKVLPSASASTEDKAAVLLDVQLPSKGSSHRYDLVRLQTTFVRPLI